MTPTYTASRIAELLGVTSRAIRHQLARIEPDSRRVVGGNITAAWSFERLPEALKDRLAQIAEDKGLCDGEQALEERPQLWQPAVPIRDLDRGCIEAAGKLQRALLPFLERRNNPRFNAQENEQLGLRDYQAVFGHPITARHFRRLHKRTLERDSGREDWARLEIYLPGNLKKRAGLEAVVSLAMEEEFRELSEVRLMFKDPNQPLPEEQELYWQHALELYDSQVLSGKSAKKLRRRLLRFLWARARWTAISFRVLRVKFERKLSRWTEAEQAPGSITDGRRLKRGIPKAQPYDEESRKKIIWHALANCGGRVSQAVRELIEQDALDPQIARSFMAPRTNKSAIPHRLRNGVTPTIRALEPIHMGRRATDKMIPSLDLRYDGISSMQCVQADDFTMPVYFWVPDGTGWYRLTRGQLLLCIDFRSLRILGYCLYPEGQYNSGLIRTLFTRVFDDWGLPEILYLERGIWKLSRLITGGPKMPFSDAQMEQGLGQFGIRFIHAKRARSKPVERVGGLLQDLMHGDPGYCGRDERRDCPEITTRNKRLVEARKAHPSELGFYSLQEWDRRLSELCAKYNGSAQDGQRLNGLSPNEALETFWNNEDPPTKFSPEHRYLLAHHQVKLPIGLDGVIKITVRGERFRYFDAQTGARKGMEVMAYFNPEMPETCTFTNLDRRDAFTVVRHQPVNALQADDLYKQEVGKAHATMGHSKAIYRMLKAEFAPSFRRTTEPTTATADLGQHIETQRAAIVAEQRQAARRASLIQTKAARLGVPMAMLENHSNPERALQLWEEAQSADHGNGEVCKEEL